MGAVRPTLRMFASAIPEVIAGLVFLLIAYPTVKLLLGAVRGSLQASGRDPLIVKLCVTVASVFLWFGTALVFLSVVGLEGIAQSLGTATGFIGLGVAYALKDMIADTVAGVYLLRDEDFWPGYRVKTADIEGVVKEIGLRKTRFELDDGHTVVLNNQEVEKKWTRLDEGDESSPKSG